MEKVYVFGLVSFLLSGVSPFNPSIGEPSTPKLILYPSPVTQFSNSVGLTLTCQTSPSNQLVSVVDWWMESESSGHYEPLQSIPGVRESLDNGSLYFLPFRREDIISSVHQARYRCSARNPMGTYLSPVFQVKAVIDEPFQVSIKSPQEHWIEGNPALLECDVTASDQAQALPYTRIIAWKQIDQFGHEREITLGDDPNYVLTLPHGNLFISYAPLQRLYVCVAQNTLNHQVKASQPFLFKSIKPSQPIPLSLVQPQPFPSKIVSEVAHDLVCLTASHPLPIWRWEQRRGRKWTPIVGDQIIGPLLRLSMETFPINGTYRCEATNPSGTVSIQYFVKYPEKLVLRMTPSRVVAYSGQNVEFSCTSNLPGETAGDFVYYQNGKPLLASSRVKMSGGLLKIINARPEDQGVYQCFGDNSSVASAELIFPVSPPELVHTFISQSVTPGPSISLKCSALGNPAPVIAWFIDDLMVSSRGESRLATKKKYLWEGQTQQSRFHISGESRISSSPYSKEVVSFLNISSVQVEDSGMYKCTAANIVRAVSHSARLNVYGGIFVRESVGKSVTYAHGETVYIPCHYGGYPVDKIIWQKDSKNLVSPEIPENNPGDPRFSMFANGTLKISDVSADGAGGSYSDKGRYTCVISNRKGEVASGSVSVNVLHPPQISPFKFEQVLVEGQRTSVLCNVISGDLPINISWLKDSQVISSHLNVTESRARFLSVLAFDELHESHSGEYTCVAENPARVVTQSATLLVRVPPKWTKVLENTKAVAGTDILLECHSKGVPSPNITWFRDSSIGKIQIEKAKTINLNSGVSLQIRNVLESDQGVYICQAENGVGGPPIIQQAKLDVIIPAKISGSEKAGSVTVAEGASAQLSCQIRGDGPLQVSWNKDSSVVLLDSAASDQRILQKISQVNSSMIRAELKIESSELADSGIYECVASNQYGRDEKKIQVEVKARPLSPEDFMVEEIGSRFIRLKWSASFQPKLSFSDPITQFRIAWRRLDESTKQLSAGYNLTLDGDRNWALIENLEPITNYRIWIFSLNKIGESLPSQPLHVLTLAEAPSGPPLNLTAVPVGPKSVLVEWKPPEVTKQHGTIIGYYVTASQQVPMGLQNVTVDVKFAEETKLIGLKPHSQYRICVKAYNSAGTGPPSPFLFIQTPEGAPDAAPRAIKCEPLSPKSVQVSWEPPPEEKQNGHIIGYKVSYLSLAGEEAGEKPEVKKTSNRETTLHGLQSWTKYRVKVLAYTVSGESIQSEMVECTTEEDVPGQVTDIKVISSGAQSVVVSWLPPLIKNGRITKFIVYWTSDPDSVVNERIVGARDNDESEYVLEIRGLRENSKNTVWIGAFTAAGPGKVSKHESVYVKPPVIPRIASFPVVKNVVSGQSVKLPCRSFVIGESKSSWFKDLNPVELSNRRKLEKNDTLHITRVKDEDEGGYKCRVENDQGSEEIIHKIVISRPPGKVNIAVGYVTHSSIQVHWDVPKISNPELTGYLLDWRMAGTLQWATVKIPRIHQSHIFEDFRCGNKYQFRVAGVNPIGRGDFSDVLSTQTFGTRPDDKPRLTEILDGNGTMIRIDLSRWPDGGCPLKNVVVEYRKVNGSSWATLGNRQNGSRVWTLSTELNQRYEFQVKVVNDAGIVSRRFSVESHSDFFKNYAKVMERVEGERSNEGSNIVPFYSDPHVIVPIASGVICTVAAAVCLLMILIKRSNVRKLERQRARDSSEWKFCGGVARHNSQQSWLSSSAGCQDKCSPGDLTDTGGITESTSIYATLNSTKPIPMTIRDNTVRLRSFDGFDNYDAPPMISPSEESHYHPMPPGFTGPSKKKRRKGSQNSMDVPIQQAISCQVEFPSRIEPPQEFRNEADSSSASQLRRVSVPSAYQQQNGDRITAPTGGDELYHDYSYPYHQFPVGGMTSSSSGEILHPRMILAGNSSTLKKSVRKQKESNDHPISGKRVSRDANEYY